MPNKHVKQKTAEEWLELFSVTPDPRNVVDQIIRETTVATLEKAISECNSIQEVGSTGFIVKLRYVESLQSMLDKLNI